DIDTVEIHTERSGGDIAELCSIELHDIARLVGDASQDHACIEYKEGGVIVQQVESCHIHAAAQPQIRTIKVHTPGGAVETNDIIIRKRQSADRSRAIKRGVHRIGGCSR